MVSCARRYDEFTRRGIELVAISVDGVARDRALTDRLALPFPVLSDQRAQAIAGWGVYDPVKQIALPSLFLLMPDLQVAYRYVGDDYADRPALDELFAAFDAATPGAPRPLERSAPPGPREPADSGKRHMPLEELPPYFRGASMAVAVLASRTTDATVRAEAERYRDIVAGFLRAATATLAARG